MLNINIITHTKSVSDSVQRIKQALGVDSKTLDLHYGCGVDKKTQYEFFKEHKIPHPEWTEDINEAKQWQKQGHTIVCRERLKGSKGAGVSIVEPGQPLVETAKIFTKYKKKKREFRVNIFHGNIVNIREKKKQGPTGSIKICNQENNWTTTHVTKPIKNELYLKKIALLASSVSKSDFIGVDVIYNEFYDEFFVLEVNSGPSIEGSSVNDFVQQIKELQNATGN